MPSSRPGQSLELDDIHVQWKHRDALARHTKARKRIEGEPYLDPEDARLNYFVPQRSDQLVSHIPWVFSVLDWIYHDKQVDQELSLRSNSIGVSRRRRSPALKWFLGSLTCLVALCTFKSLEGVVRNGGRYDPVRYREWLYARVARNKRESRKISQPRTTFDPLQHEDPNAPLLNRRTSDYEAALSLVDSASHVASGARKTSSKPAMVSTERELGPKTLCFVDDATGSYRAQNVKDWMRDHKTTTPPNFVFVSYTRFHFVVDSAADILQNDRFTQEEKEAALQRVPIDKLAIAQYGVQAARRARLPAFWLDFECMKPDVSAAETSRYMSDPYRISDIVRIAAAMAIVSGPPWHPNGPFNESEWLKVWGSRLWCVPEALLCPTESFELYTRGHDLQPNFTPTTTLKRSLAPLAFRDTDECPDASNMRQLIDHYEGSLHLTPLELVSIAFDVLRTRRPETHGGKQSEGGASYALMGLLRRRPNRYTDEGEFEAFARLSLANDGDKLLERLLCMQPMRKNALWHDMRDAWDAQLWDIEPHCQVAGIVDNRTITLDGAFGASIHWTSLEQVAFVKRQTLLRTFAKAFIRIAPVYLIFGLLLVIAGGATRFDGGYSGQFGDNSSNITGINVALIATGSVILAFALALVFLLPTLLSTLYLGAFWSTQASFFGIEGIPDLGFVEKSLFGTNEGRIKWSSAGSMLSDHTESKDGECVGLPPSLHRIDDGSPTRLFTLVDSFTLTATAFRAEKPPSTVMICGREGGMARAVLCSYEPETQTFCRETVLRMKTLVLERMSRVDRFHFCLTRNGRERG